MCGLPILDFSVTKYFYSRASDGGLWGRCRAGTENVAKFETKKR